MLQLETFLPYRINVLAKRVSKELARRYQDQFGISIPEWRVIAILGREQPLSSNDIVERSQMDKAKVSRAVARLVETGFLARAVHQQDQRLLRLSFTPAGRDLYERIAPLALEWERQLLDCLAPAEREELTRLLDRLDARLDRMAEE
ncbi:MarR family winged helix-turn-helix transcriptional regulator [Indioceanicola profundi]|uniref:MarR family winged helix-turn-helix transcriptional regulator n=1 Tax=Indioceanicola profundi TaxID=2220096 RepID=UPI000E6AA593|nr:MarR family transcriptional regulator [Indioceanicola profundi]